ncbi:FmdB family zinc ribbon protein [Prauserella shujinwangii]|uniref:FmdB family zinc ribbon protein n=1 Tax=Prauserella shujinwangii TaxID=1453103 RepID=UPI000D04B29E|nr:zinc ribbon domain-containing protein [Prauserella shujinwangii]
MATYVYRCARCGDFERQHPMGEAAATRPCPDCGEPAARRYTAPAVRHTTPSSWSRAREYAQRSAESPEVVSAPPPRGASGGVRVSRDPRHARLPRP